MARRRIQSKPRDRARRSGRRPFWEPLDFFPVTYQTLTLAVADRVATITINRPEKLNALNAATIAELEPCARDALA